MNLPLAIAAQITDAETTDAGLILAENKTQGKVRRMCNAHAPYYFGLTERAAHDTIRWIGITEGAGCCTLPHKVRYSENAEWRNVCF